MKTRKKIRESWLQGLDSNQHDPVYEAGECHCSTLYHKWQLGTAIFICLMQNNAL